MRNQVVFCPNCNRPFTRVEVKRGINFECPSCRALLCFDMGATEKWARPIVMLLITLVYAWRHGWDGGFVIFLLGFYGCVGLFVYLFFVLPLLPGKLRMIAPPVSKDYLETKPLSEALYDVRVHSLRPLGITGQPSRGNWRK